MSTGRISEILRVFLKLGCTRFGGPVVHPGYFRNEFVIRRRWLSENRFADLVALCQFLPGPASSQVGFSIGIHRGGILGGMATWIGFIHNICDFLIAAAAFGLLQFGRVSVVFVLIGCAAAAVILYRSPPACRRLLQYRCREDGVF